jgi:hypothetical protein
MSGLDQRPGSGVASGRAGFSSHALFELLAAEVDFAGAIDGVRSFWFREPSLIKWGQVSRVYAALCWRSSRWETRVRRPLRSRLVRDRGRKANLHGRHRCSSEQLQ